MTKNNGSGPARDALPKDVDALARRLEQHQQGLLGAVANIKAEVKPPKAEPVGFVAAEEAKPKNPQAAQLAIVAAGVVSLIVVVVLIKRRKQG